MTVEFKENLIYPVVVVVFKISAFFLIVCAIYIYITFFFPNIKNERNPDLSSFKNYIDTHPYNIVLIEYIRRIMTSSHKSILIASKHFSEHQATFFMKY